MPLLTESNQPLLTEQGTPFINETEESPMSSPSTSFRLFYPDSNTVNSVTLHNAAGVALTPQTITDGTLDPAGFKSKVVTFAAASEPLFATPTFANPAAPVSLYLTRDDAGVYKKVLDESVFDPAQPGRPSPKGDLQQWRVYTETDQGNGIKTYAVSAPGNPIALIRPLGKDPLTGEARYGNDFLFRWSGVLAGLIQVEVDIDDIIDPTGFFEIPVSDITTYAESSVGLSLVKAAGQIIPQDGLEHLLKFRLRYNVNGDVSAYTQTATYSAVHKMLPPTQPVSLSAALLRDRVDSVPDVVHFEWEKAATNGGDAIEIYTRTVLNKTHLVYSSNGSETSARVDNISRFVVRETGPAVAEDFDFYIVSKNISGKSDEVFAPQTLAITTKLKSTAPPTPDELAGTAEEVNYATLKAQTQSAVITALGVLPPEGPNIINSAMDAMIHRVKDIISKGGNVTLNDFGVIAAKWTKERLARNPSTGEPIVVPAYRSLGFTPSIGFKTGTRNGTIMTDAEAKL